MLYENYKNVTDTCKANVINAAVHQLIKDAYNEYVDAYTEMQDYFALDKNIFNIGIDK